MTTKKQREAAQQNVKKAQKRWQEMSRAQRARRQPQGRDRARPATKGSGDYYHVEVRDKNDFVTFRTHDVGRAGHAQRVAGKRESGSWSTVKWLIAKDDAHVDDGTLVADTAGAKKILGRLDAKPRHVRGDRFQAAPRRNVPERDKPTQAQKAARRRNLQKAQKARQDGRSRS